MGCGHRRRDNDGRDAFGIHNDGPGTHSKVGAAQPERIMQNCTEEAAALGGMALVEHDIDGDDLATKQHTEQSSRPRGRGRAPELGERAAPTLGSTQ
jgi:hypothetical protein